MKFWNKEYSLFKTIKKIIFDSNLLFYLIQLVTDYLLNNYKGLLL